MYRRNILALAACFLSLTIVTSERARGQASEEIAATKPAVVGANGRAEFARLLPPETLAYVRVVDAPKVRADWWETAAGQMAQDPQFKPLWDQLFAALEKAFEPAKEKVGLSINELITLPRGELGFAVVPVTGAPPAVLLFVEAPENDRSVDTLIERGRATALEGGWIEESEQVGDVKLTILRRGAGKTEKVIYLRHQGVLVISTDIDACKKLISLWTGAEVGTLAEQPAFTTLDRLIGRAEGAPAQISWFIDPINLFRALAEGNVSAQVGLAMLPALGLDGLTALGGSFTFNRGPFEIIGQAYLLLDVPRAGVLELIALQPTKTEPEAWVFEEVAAYHTFTWDVERTYYKLKSIIDSFAGEGSFGRRVREAAIKEVDVDIEADLLPQLDGRASALVWIEQPVSIMSRCQLWGIHLKDGKKFQPVFDKFVAKLGDKLEKKSYAGTTYYQAARREERKAGPNAVEIRVGPGPRVTLCLVDDCLLIGDGSSVMEKALATAGGGAGRLGSSLEYKLILAKAKRYAGEQGTGYFGFTRPDEEIRYLHGLAVNERTQEQLARGAEKNAFFRDVQQALADRPLPSVEVLQRYYAPGGTIIVDEPTGVRYLAFVLRRDGENK
ncbi:MAG: hypothetical protein JNL96_25725 [Planctomycetaceae bacterium]|nr:hypothetical protein [Planctomycetaceae bacterium]